MNLNINNITENFIFSENEEIPLDITNWIGTLKLLVGVPINYIIPNINMLPPESIRFFYLDPNWIESLADGALSLCRVTNLDHQVDVFHHNMLHAQANKTAANYRKSLFKSTNKSTDNTETEDDPNPDLLTGFILRSLVVKDYPGIEVNVYAKNNEELKIRRLEKLSPDILIGIVQGELYSLKIHQAPEALHFGIDCITDDGKGFKKNLRTTDEGKIKESQKVIHFREGDKKVLPISALSEQMREDLSLPKDKFTSAEFALEMIEGLKLIEFSSDQ